MHPVVVSSACACARGTYLASGLGRTRNVKTVGDSDGFGYGSRSYSHRRVIGAWSW